MSQPFQRAWSGQTDANGNLTVTLVPFASWASSFIVAGQAKGNPIWSIFNNGQFVLPGAGPQVGLGQVYFRAQEQLTIQIQGAMPNSTVQGTLWGRQSTTADGSDLVPSQPQASGSVATFSPQVVIGSIQTAGNGVPVTQTFPLPSGTLAIGWQVQFTGFGNPQLIQMVGHQTGKVYLAGGPISSPPNDLEVAMLTETDSSIDCTVQDSGTQADLVFFLTWMQNPVVIPRRGPPGIGSVIPVTFNPADTNSNPGPAPWQAANQPPKEFSINLAAAGVQHIIPGVAGKTIYLHHIFAAVSAAGAFAGNWQDTAASLVTSDTLQNGGPRLLSFAGAPLPGGAGAGLDFNVTAAGASFLGGHVAYSLG